MKRRLYKYAKILIISAIFFLMAHRLTTNWSSLNYQAFRFKTEFLLLGLTLFLAQGFVWVFLWRRLLIELGYLLGFRRSFRIYYYSQGAKYLPGGIWGVLGRTYLCEREKIPRGVAFSSIVIETALCVISGAIVVVLFFAQANFLETEFLFLATAVIVVGLIFLNPKIFFPMANFFLKITRHEPLSTSISYRAILKLISSYVFAWLLGGVGFYFLTSSVTSLPLAKMGEIIGIFSAAGITSIVAFFAPAGLGVREGVLVLSLSRFTPQSVAILVALFARLWMTVSEVLLIFLAWLTKFADGVIRPVHGMGYQANQLPIPKVDERNPYGQK